MTQHEKPRQTQADHVPAAHQQVTGAGPTVSAALWSAALLEPRHPVASISEMASLPLLFWLVAELRPALTVQIGVGKGGSFMGLCQAVERVGTPSRLLALPIGNEALGTEAAEQHALLYSEIAHLGAVPAESHNFCVDLEHQPVQLLILHDVNEQICAEWLVRLSRDAVVLVCSSGTLSDDAQLDRLKQALPQPFDHIGLSLGSNSFEVFLIGSSLPQGIRQLTEDRPFAEAMQTLLQRLAEGMQHQGLAGQRLRALQKAKTQLAAVEKQVESLRRETDAALRTEASEVAKASVLQARVFDLTQDIQKLMQERADLAELKARLQEVNDGNIKREQVLAEQALKLEASEAKLAESQKLAAGQIEDIRHLTELVEKQRPLAEKAKTLAAQVESLKNERDEIHSRSSQQLTAREVALAQLAEDLETARTAQSAATALAAQRQSELRNLTAFIREAEETIQQMHRQVTQKQAEAEEKIQQVHGLVAQKQAEIDALRASTSWRITHPIRKIKDGLRYLIG